MVRESHYQSIIAHALERAGATVLNVHGHAFQKSGWPDLQVYSPIWTGHLEIKNEEGGTKKLQMYIMEKLIRSGTRAYVLRVEFPDLVLEKVRRVEGELSSKLIASLPDWFKEKNGRDLLLWLEQEAK